MKLTHSFIVPTWVCLLLAGVCGLSAAAQGNLTAEQKAVQAKTIVLRAVTLFETGHHEEAIKTMSKALTLEPDKPDWLQRRGEMRFRSGQIKASLEDFDRVIKLMPKYEPYHWQRGISYYYAGQFKAGRKQFELHQEVNSNDVENAVWHFLCVARAEGLEEARANLIPISGDTRVPMKHIHELFAGEGSPKAVVSAAQTGGADEATILGQLMYAHLYLGLYFEATGNEEQAAQHIKLAATQFAQDHYMGDVAKVHYKILSKKKKTLKSKE